MQNNSATLANAKKVKRNEFYTEYRTIEDELKLYSLSSDYGK